MIENSTTKDPDSLLDFAGVAAIIGIPENTVRKWRVTAYGPIGFTVGKHVRFRRSDVLAWIDVQVRQAA